MSRANDSSYRLDVALVIISIAVLIAALWVWISALPVEREVVVLATTIALVIALVLVLNASILVILRLQRRVSKLEDAIIAKEEPGVAAEEESVIVVTLSNTERRIINRLEENDGRMAQDELRRVTGLSKSTLSVALQTLERKDLIERETSGRTKIVSLRRKLNR
ncbi:MAG: helix-turn-helix transcriptional regulator [Promethearchaeota archaeon]